MVKNNSLGRDKNVKLIIRKLTSTILTWATLPLRLAVGIVFIAHGAQKVFGTFGGPDLAKWTLLTQLASFPLCYSRTIN